MKTLEDFLGGLCPIRRGFDSRMILVLKTSREIAQTARLHREFTFYVVPVHVDGMATYGLATAFFDDHDEPLVIHTPLFKEEFTRDLLLLLSSDSFYVHFFDEHNRELLGFRAENPNALRFCILSNTMRFAVPTRERARLAHNEMQDWFGVRSSSDDAAALTVLLRERLFPDCLAEYVDNPGDFNEPDIVNILHRSFRDDQVFANPVRVDNGREFVDVLVVTSKTVLLIQAKDSPSTESALTRKITRKIGTTDSHVRRAARQLKGSINHLRSEDSIEIITNGKHRNVTMSGRDVFGLVIVKELFDYEQPSFSSPIFNVTHETGITCLVLDHVEFHQLTFYRTTEESFVGTLKEIFSNARECGVFPRNRFGLVTNKSVVSKLGGTGIKADHTSREMVKPIARGRRVITPLRPEHQVPCEVARAVSSRRDSGADWLRVVVDRAEVEALDVSRTAVTLSRVLVDRNAVVQYRGLLDLAFFGYSNDPRELCEIPEVRHFCSKLDEVFPYWFYFLSTDGVTLWVIASCLCSVQLRPGVIEFSPDLIEFITRHYETLNWLFDNYSLDESHNVEISHNVAEYFSKLEPKQ